MRFAQGWGQGYQFFENFLKTPLLQARPFGSLIWRLLHLWPLRRGSEFHPQTGILRDMRCNMRLAPHLKPEPCFQNSQALVLRNGLS